MRVYKHSTSTDIIPYMDNCYIGEKRNENDIDVTDVYSLFEFCKVNQIDYIQYRNYCKEYLLPNWDNLDKFNKKELVKHNICINNFEKLIYYTIEEQFKNYFTIINYEVNAREERWREAMITAGFMIGNDQLKRLSMYNDTKSFRGDYIEADLPNLILWLTNGTYPALGIDYSSIGFRSKFYYDANIENAVLEILTK